MMYATILILIGIVACVGIGSWFVLREVFSEKRPYNYDEDSHLMSDTDNHLRLVRESERRIKRILKEIDVRKWS
jgi:hypothetical protein